MWNRIAQRIATRWLLSERLHAKSASQMEVRTRGGLLVGQAPDDKRAGAWLGHLLGLSFQPEIVMDMKATGKNKQSMYDGIYVGRPAGRPPAGLSYLKQGKWLVWNGTQWTKGTPPSTKRDNVFRRDEMGSPLTPAEVARYQSRRRVHMASYSPQMQRGQKFRVEGHSQLEDLDSPGDWIVTRLAKHIQEPTYILEPAGGGRPVQHYAEDVDALLN